MNRPQVTIHNDLCDSNSEPVAWQFCAPIFIADQFGIHFQSDSELFSPVPDKLPETRNGTLTFVEFEGKVYGITCRHVVDVLRQKNRENQEHWKKEYGIDYQLPSIAQYHFFIPKNQSQIHVNSHFHDAPGDQFTGERPDISIARVAPGILSSAGRKPIPLKADSSGQQVNEPGFCGIAIGYPEQKRSGSTVNKMLNTLHVSEVAACAPFASFENSLLMYAELDEDPDIYNLSGMSGGPILWSCDSGWGLAGIMKKARDISNLPGQGEASFSDKPTIWVEGDRLTLSQLVELMKSIPENEEPIQDLSKSLYIPKNFKPRI